MEQWWEHHPAHRYCVIIFQQEAAGRQDELRRLRPNWPRSEFIPFLLLLDPNEGLGVGPGASHFWDVTC